MTPGPVDYNRIEIKHMKRGQLFDHINIPMVGGFDLFRYESEIDVESTMTTSTGL